MSTLSMYNDIPKGRKNAISRQELAARWGVSDREVRRRVQELRCTDFYDNYIIISTSSGRGYYKTDDREEIRRYKNEIMRRATNTFKPLDRINKVLGCPGDQMSLF